MLLTLNYEVTILHAKYLKSSWNCRLFKGNISILTCEQSLRVPVKAFQKNTGLAFMLIMCFFLE